MRRWIVQAGDGATVGEIVRRMEDPDALAEGRVFVGQRRVAAGDERVQVGDEVLVYPARARGEAPRVLGERAGVVALFKPAALPTVADHRGQHCLLSWASGALGRGALHATSRLDVGVSGVVLVATDERSRTRLAQAREQGSYRRTYLAIASREPSPPAGEWRGAIGKAQDPRRRQVDGRDATPSATRYERLAAGAKGAALLRVEPITGRTHQIRVHAAHAGAALLGDGVYGGPVRLVSATGAVLRLGRIALHAWRVEVPDASGAPWVSEAPVPDELRAMWRAAGGADEAWPG